MAQEINSKKLYKGIKELNTFGDYAKRFVNKIIKGVKDKYNSTGK